LHLKSKEVAWGGIMMALAVIFIILSGIIEQSSLFLLAAASFITGVFQRRFSARAGAAFIAGTFLSGLFLAPQKLYCFTFAGFSIYVAVAEYLRAKNVPAAAAMAIKGICYHILLASAIVAAGYFIGFDMFFTEGWIKRLSDMPVLFVTMLIVAAEALWILFDRAYIFFQERYGGRLAKAGD